MVQKDYFSDRSDAYAAYRPTYPAELYTFLLGKVQERSCAWDCATGNGQVARHLAPHFEKVFATDISEKQLRHATPAANITYSVCAAEKTPFADNSFDLITVGQALHWLSLPEFYAEVQRTARPGALLAAWGYSLLSVDGPSDEHIRRFYYDTVGSYWDSARTSVENHYGDLHFPFAEVPCPSFFIELRWTIDHLAGYVSSWSATRKFVQANGRDPVPGLKEQLSQHWPPGKRKAVRFPVFMKAGRL